MGRTRRAPAVDVLDGTRGRVADLDALEPFPSPGWPEPDAANYETLREAIRARGRVDVPLDVVRRGRRFWLVDGRSRLRAIKELRADGVAVAWRYNEIELADPKVLHFLVAKATAGRHLSIEQRAAYVVEHVLPEYERRAAERQRAGLPPLPGSETTQGGEHGRATELAARYARLKPTTLKAAKFVRARCDEFPDVLGPRGLDLWGKLKRGEMKVGPAKALAIAETQRRPGRATASPSRPARASATSAAVEPIPDRLLKRLNRIKTAAGVDTPGEAVRVLLEYVAGPGRDRWPAWLARVKRRR